jgi:hypothetical protein
MLEMRGTCARSNHGGGGFACAEDQRNPVPEKDTPTGSPRGLSSLFGGSSHSVRAMLSVSEMLSMSEDSGF